MAFFYLLVFALLKLTSIIADNMFFMIYFIYLLVFLLQYISLLINYIIVLLYLITFIVQRSLIILLHFRQHLLLLCCHFIFLYLNISIV